MKSSTPKRLAWFSAIACVGCCAIIPALVTIGVTGVIGFAWYFDMAAIGFFALSVSLLGYAIYRKKSSTCSLSCYCKTNIE